MDNVTSLGLFIRGIILSDHNLPTLEQLTVYNEEKLSSTSSTNRWSIDTFDIAKDSIDREGINYDYPKKRFDELRKRIISGKANGLNTIGLAIGYSDKEIHEAINAIKDKRILSQYNNVVEVGYLEIEANQLFDHSWNEFVVEGKDGGIIFVNNFDSILSMLDSDNKRAQVIDSLKNMARSSSSGISISNSCSIIVFGSNKVKTFFDSLSVFTENVEFIQKGKESESAIYTNEWYKHFRNKMKFPIIGILLIALIWLIIKFVLSYH